MKKSFIQISIIILVILAFLLPRILYKDKVPENNEIAGCGRGTVAVNLRNQLETILVQKSVVEKIENGFAIIHDYTFFGIPLRSFKANCDGATVI